MSGSIAVVKVNLTDGNAKRGPSLAFPILLLGRNLVERGLLYRLFLGLAGRSSDCRVLVTEIRAKPLALAIGRRSRPSRRTGPIGSRIPGRARLRGHQLLGGHSNLP
jgi:hypothetical protein